MKEESLLLLSDLQKLINQVVLIDYTIIILGGDFSMSSLFEDLKEGLEEAIAYEKGYGAGRVKTYMILPVKEYSGKEIRDIRTKAGMTQSVFASYMGVSIKTVEAWEGGRTHPTGPVFRLLDILSKSEEMEYIVAK